MITVKCGFPECKWKHTLVAEGWKKSTNHTFEETHAMAELLSHYVKSHGIPSAIWER